MRTVAIAGIGLIGGSFALALRRAGFDGEILGVQSRSCAQALELGAIDEAVPLDQACRRADLLYLAQPVKAILSTLSQIAGHVPSTCLVTDAGSTKTEICRHAVTCGIPSFLGGHPMAGKESSGIASAEADLFESRTYVLTPLNGSLPATTVCDEFRIWLQRIGSKVTLLSPQDHDRVVALTSHLPQVLSSCLAATLAEEELSYKDLQVSGSGLRDTTRLALSSYEVWTDIFGTNRDSIDRAITKYIDKLNFFRQNLTNPELCEEFDKAARVAADLRRSSESEGAN